MWAIFVGWLPYMWLVVRVTSKLPMGDLLAVAGAAAGMIAWMLSIGRVGSFRCPRCGERFHTENGFPWITRMWAWRCMNCGLRRWRDPTDAG